MPIHQNNTTSDLPSDLKQALQLLITANHILHYHDLVDAFGHISLRHPHSPSLYIIAAYDPGAPALVSSRNDFIEYRVEDSEPAYPPQPKGYSERFIHGEIYKRWPQVNCVVHSHSESVIPFTVSSTPVKPVFHMAGFLGVHGPPIYDVTKLYSTMDNPGYDMLVKNSFLGSHLADAFGVRTTSSTGQWPEYAVVLQSKHGFTCVGESVQQAVYRAIYTQKNCKLLKDAVDLAKGGQDGQRVGYLTEKEVEGCKKMNEMTQDKAFRLWVREVQVNPLYQTDEGVPSALPVGGMRDE